MQYNQVVPDAVFPSYDGGTTVTFTIEALAGQALVGGSLILDGQLTGYAKNGSGDYIASDMSDVFLDGFAGIHSVFDSIQTSSASQGTIENLVAYNTVMTNHFRVTSDRTSTRAQSELAYPSAIIRQQQLSPTYGAGEFSMKPFTCLNRMNGELFLAKTGPIRITFKLADIQNAFTMMSASTPTEKYSLKDLKLRFVTVGMDVPPDQVAGIPPIRMRTFQTIRQTVNSSTPTIALKAPVAADAFSVLMVPSELVTGTTKAKTFNNLVSRLPGNFTSARLYIDSQETRLYTRDMNFNDVVDHFVKSFRGGETSLAYSTGYDTRTFGVGTTLTDPVDFMNANASLSMTSASFSIGSPYIIYVVFHGFMDL